MLELQSDPRGLRELLRELVENFKFELSFLSKATGVDINSLEKFLDGRVDLLGLDLPLERMSKFTRTISMLSMDITMVNDDDRVRGILEHLTIHGLEPCMRPSHTAPDKSPLLFIIMQNCGFYCRQHIYLSLNFLHYVL